MSVGNSQWKQRQGRGFGQGNYKKQNGASSKNDIKAELKKGNSWKRNYTKK